MYLPSSGDIDRLYIPRSDGGRGLAQLELSYKTGFQKYLEITEDWMIICVDENAMNKEHYSIKKQQHANKFKREFHVGKMCQ